VTHGSDSGGDDGKVNSTTVEVIELLSSSDDE
jgi:hypothetical protein